MGAYALSLLWKDLAQSHCCKTANQVNFYLFPFSFSRLLVVSILRNKTDLP